MAEELPPIKPFPPPPNSEDFPHLSEFEKMVRGLPYRPLDNELDEIKIKPKNLLDKFNQLPAIDNAGRREILDELLHPSCKGKHIWIKPIFRCSIGFNLKVGNNFFANNDCILYDTAPIEIGNDCKFGPGVHIYTPTHPLDSTYRMMDDRANYYELALPVKIGDNCWLGGGSIICPGVTLGDNVVVGAGAVVTKSFGSNVVIAGNPARVIRHMPEPSVPKESFWKDELKQ